MKYVEFINQALKQRLVGSERSILYGQNVAAGSCLGGLTRGLSSTNNLRVMNTTNTENGLFGLGFGLMLSNVNAVFAMKQHDFMLLGVDQLANSNYGIQNRTLQAGFTILTVVVDSGFEGPQAALNNLSEIASVARLPCLTLNSAPEIQWAINTQMLAPGARILAVSQRLYHTPVLEQPSAKLISDGVFQHTSGTDITIAVYNFALPQALRFVEHLDARSISAELFTIPDMMGAVLTPVIESARRTRRLAIIDDTKSMFPPSLAMCDANVIDSTAVTRVHVRRQPTRYGFAPNSDEFVLNHEQLSRQFGW